MLYCSQCGFWLKEDAKFCPQCGAPAPVMSAEPKIAEPPVVEAAVPVAEPVIPVPQPVYSVPQPVMPVAVAEPVVSTKDKVLGFVGMGLSIFGLFMAVVGILYTFAGMFEPGLGFGMSISFGMFSVAPAIVGRCLCAQSIRNGNCGTPCSVGMKLSLAAIIVAGVMQLMGIINLLEL
ncbi:MAG: zinc-ribbon domain-containing protein [Oscillospiraceae bacterium]|nr:zinc-ribbon domain-containing protein [Oscillospiraceae bacterium]